MALPGYIFSELWDADAHRRRGDCPWTFFGYPRALADEQRLPLDKESVRFLVALHHAGVRVGILADPLFPTEYCFACPFEDMQRLNEAIGDLERRGEVPSNFCSDRSQQLLSVAPTVFLEPERRWVLPITLSRRDVFCLLVALIMFLCANLPRHGENDVYTAGVPMTFATWSWLYGPTFAIPAFVMDALIGGTGITLLAMLLSFRTRSTN